MPDGLMTISDLAVFKESPLKNEIATVPTLFPFLNKLRVDNIMGTSYKTPVITAVPAGEWRAENTGKTDKKGTITTREATMKFYDASWMLDVQVAASDSKGIAHAQGVSAKAALLGCLAGIESQILYGDSTTSGFDGLVKILKAAGRTVSAEGTSATEGTSILLLNTAIYAVLLGEGNCLFSRNPVQGPAKVQDSSAKSFYAYHQRRDGFVGIDALDYDAGCVITNIDTTKTVDDDLIYKALSTFKAGKEPNLIVMSRRSREQLRNSRTATNATGAPAPLVTSVEGIPVVISEAIKNDEDLSE